MSLQAFIHLLKHEFRWGRNDKADNSGNWWIAYVAAVAVAGFVLYTWAVVEGKFKPQYLWNFVLGLPFAIFMLGFNMILREWKNGTNGWWLSLPYPRLSLLLAKYAAVILQSFILITAALAGCMLFSVYASVLKAETFGQEFLFRLFQGELVWYGLILIYSPFMAAFGLLTGTVTQSRWRPLAPLMWLGFGISGNALWWIAWFGGWMESLSELDQSGEAMAFSLQFPFVFLLAPLVALSCLLLLWSGRILDKDLNL